MLQKLISLPRIKKQLILFFLDCFLLIFALFLSFFLRLGLWYLPSNELLLLIFISPVVAIPIFYRFGLYRAITRYLGFQALWSIIQAVTLYALVWGIIVLMMSIYGTPRSVIIINWFLTIVLVGGARMLARWLLSQSKKYSKESKVKKVLIYGAGSSGRELLFALSESEEYHPLGYIDDNIDLQNKSINGVEVFRKNDLSKLIKEKQVSQVLLAMPNLTRKKRIEIISFLESHTVEVRSLPSVINLAKGKVTVNDLHEIEIQDLLGRDTTPSNGKILEFNINNKVVMVTGAGGSIGSELCRQIFLLKPSKIILYEISEVSLYQIEQEMIIKNEIGIEICPILGSVTDKDRVKKIIDYFKVETIYHAAAYKHVPLVEYNPTEGILNNVFGTLNLAEVAISSGVKTFVFISTDKAVRPTNIMGATKRVAELILQSLSSKSNNTTFSMVRFGNVLDSSGSVIPLFKKQIKEGGPVTVTHPEITRYFMTIPEAIELVLQVGAMAKDGEVFVLDMGEPVRIYDLAVKMINLSGLVLRDSENPKGDIEIQFSGLRPGEKLYEELLVDGNFEATENELIWRANENDMIWDKLQPTLAKLKESAKIADEQKCYKLLSDLLPQFKPQSNSFKSI